MFVAHQDGIYVLQFSRLYVDRVDCEGFGGGFEDDSCVFVEPYEHDCVFFGCVFDEHYLIPQVIISSCEFKGVASVVHAAVLGKICLVLSAS